ncbi:hypothetical protein D3C81_1926480 [compost metagenome]
MPAQRQQVLSGAGKKLLFAQRNMVFIPGVGGPGNVTMRHQQLRLFLLAEFGQQAVLTGAGRPHQPDQFSHSQNTLFPCRQTWSICT